MEDDTRALAHLSDDWVRHPNDCIHQELLPTGINTDQKTIDDWRANGPPAMHHTIIPFVKNYMLASATNGSAELTESQLRENFLMGIRPLIKDGCKVDEQYARAAMCLTEQPTGSLGGRERIVVRWGEKVQRIDYAAQPLQVGTLNFPAIDLGDVVTLSLSTQKALRAPHPRGEKSMCLASFSRGR